MQEAISQNDLVADSPRAAMETFKQASTVQCVNAHLARTAARDAKITLIEAYIQRQSGFPASEELSRASWTGTIAEQYPIFAAHPSSDPIATAPLPQQTSYTVPTRRDGSYRPNFVTSVARSFQIKLRPAAGFRNQYVDGSVPLPRGGACFKCVVAGHYPGSRGGPQLELVATGKVSLDSVNSAGLLDDVDGRSEAISNSGSQKKPTQLTPDGCLDSIMSGMPPATIDTT
ncbi:hypothetical protein E4U17_002870 [Claviceps sp. LM77 group G4]|nr:hypothetical protein E4U17_002870 [Claviceps sp. LM77 group G4]KAG6069412.1 hypothetical protein E4U33_004859 [Claviceps sp. LM78 group G4]KAG6072831.1 hypothetical protein E4U16_005087 [Claviceps sp. LM84 group G4]